MSIIAKLYDQQLSFVPRSLSFCLALWKIAFENFTLYEKHNKILILFIGKYERELVRDMK